MLEKVLVTTTNDSVYIYDGVFEVAEQRHFKVFAENCHYKVLTNTVNVHDYNDNVLFQAYFSPEDLQNLSVLKNENFRYILKKHCDGLEIFSAWVIASNHSTKNYFHTDSVANTITGKNFKTLIFYMNMKWNLNDGGETLFCNKFGDVELAVSPFPNRVVIFDSEILHKASSQDVDAKELRYALVIKLSEPSGE